MKPGALPGSRFAWLLAASLAAAVPAAVAQGAAGASGPLRVEAVDMVVTGALAEGEGARRQQADLRRAFGIYPGRTYNPAEIELALERMRAAQDVRVQALEYRFDAGDGVHLVLTVDVPGSPPPPRAPADRLRLIDDGEKLLKLRLGLKGAFAVSASQWFGNESTLTRFNPRGRFDGGRGPNAIFDLAPSVGAAAAVPLRSGTDAPYLYGSVLYLGTGSVGQDNNRSDTRTTGQWEEAFFGVVASGTTDAGSTWRANVSYGMQPYCIGNGMLVCQIAASGGDRGADFAWPRWSGRDFLKVQMRFNDTLAEAFRFRPNDAPDTATTLVGVNLEHDLRPGQTLGFTWMEATSGRLQYFFPDGSSRMRDGLRVWHLRGSHRPEAGQSAPC